MNSKRRRYKRCLKCWLISELWALSFVSWTRREGLWPACPAVPSQDSASLQGWPWQQPQEGASPGRAGPGCTFLALQPLSRSHRNHLNPFCSRVQLVTKHILFFFLMGKRVAASFHSNTYAHNIVCSCHHCWRGWLLLCLAGTVVVSFCPCSEGTPLVLQLWRRWARNKPGNILQVLPVSLLCVCL